MTDKEQDIEEIEKDDATEDAEVEKDENEDGFGEDE
jgi:hypothetical protein